MQLGRIAIIGASGFLGKKVFKTFLKVHLDTIGTSFTKQELKMFHLDILDEEQIERFIRRFNPKVIIYIAGESDPNQVEINFKKSTKLNVDAIDSFSKYFKGHFIYISTDYIFDGTNPPYNIDSLPHPLNKYGETKLLGEQKTLSKFKKATIIRCGLLYGYLINNSSIDPTPLREGIRKIIRKLSSRLKGGSYSKTFKFQKDGVWFVRKEAFGEGREKLINEINWLLGLKEEIKSYFPKVLKFDIESDLVFYEMLSMKCLL